MLTALCPTLEAPIPYVQLTFLFFYKRWGFHFKLCILGLPISAFWKISVTYQSVYMHMRTVDNFAFQLLMWKRMIILFCFYK